MQPNKQVIGHLAALFTITVWSVTFISTKVLLVSFTPIEVMFYRLLLAILALLIISPPQIKHLNLRGEWKVMAAGLCGVTLYFIFQNTALSLTLAANVSVLVSIAPLLTAIASRFFLQEQLKPHFFLGFVLAIFGICLIAFNGGFVLKLNPLGDLFSILAALVWAFYNILIKKISSQQGDMLAITRKVVFYGFLFSIPLLPFFEFRLGWERLLVFPNYLNLLFLGVVASALCYITWNVAVHLLGPVKTSLYIYLVPLIAILASTLFLQEPLTPLAVVGVFLILSGMAISERTTLT